MLAVALFHLSALLSIQLIALTFAIFLFIYVKKQELSKWYTFIATAIVGIVMLIMLATLIGVICMAARPHRESENEKEKFNRNEMRHHWRGYRDRYENEEGDYGHERRNWNREEEEEGEGRRNFHHRDMEERSEHGSMSEEKRVEMRDSIIKSKMPKK